MVLCDIFILSLKSRTKEVFDFEVAFLLCLYLYRDVPSAGWSRVGGVLCILFGSYYIGCAWDDAEGRFPRRFYQSTVIGRLFLCFAFLGLVLVGQLPKGLMILAAVNALSAWSLHRAMVSRVRDA